MSPSEWNDPVTVPEMYGEWGIDADAVHAALGQSRDPVAASSLYETFGALGIGAGDTALDIGARDARYSVELAERFGCRVVAVDPIDVNLRDARAAVAGHDCRELVEIREGSIERIPAADGEFTAIWSRDMLNHIEDIDPALGECVRVLAPGGAMLVYQTFATQLLEPAEAQRIYADLAIVPERMSVAGFEEAVARAGLAVESVEIVGSQWREAWEEDGSHRTTRQLLHAARLRRKRDDLVAELGEVPYRVELANALWGVYQMIGKLEPRVYVLRG